MFWLRRGVVVCTLACGPALEDDGDESSTSATGSTSGVTTTTGEASSLGSTTTAAGSSTSDETSGSIDCAAFGADVCPEGCMTVNAYSGSWDDPQVGFGQAMCVAIGSPIDETYRSAWWTEIAGQLWFVESGIECVNGSNPELLAASPLDWSECTGAPADPAPCRRRFCAQDSCPGELDVAIFEACELEEPCGSVFFYDLACLLPAWRDRIPGRYPINADYPNQGVDWVVIVHDDGSATATFIEVHALICPLGIWQPARRCQLAEPQFFDDCIAKYTMDCWPDALTLQPWILDCIDEPASCR